MTRWKGVKCRHFNWQGETSIWGVCPKTRSTCEYVHPEDPEWEEIRRHKLPSYLRGRGRDRDRDFSRGGYDRDGKYAREREQDWERNREWDWERSKEKDVVAQGYQRTRADSIASSLSNASMAVDRADKRKGREIFVRSDSLSSKSAATVATPRTSPSKAASTPSNHSMAPPPTIPAEKRSTALPTLKSTSTATSVPTAPASFSQALSPPSQAPSSSTHHGKQFSITAPSQSAPAPNTTTPASAGANLPSTSSIPNSPQKRPASATTPSTSTQQQTLAVDITMIPASESATIPGLGSETVKVSSTNTNPPPSEKSMLPPSIAGHPNSVARIRAARESEHAESKRAQEAKLQQQTSEAQTSSSTIQPAPPPPPGTPPPLPSLPDLAPKAAPADQNISADAKLKIWTERIKLIADALSCEEQITDLTDSLAELSTYSSAPNFATDPSERKEIDENIKELKSTRDTTKQKRQKIIDSLLGKTELWPTMPSFQEVEARNEEIKKQIKDLADQVQSIKDWYAKLKSAHTDDTKETLKRKRKETASDAMDVDSGAAEDVSEMEAEATAASSVASDQLKVFRNRLQSLEQFYGELENDMFQAIETQVEKFREKVGDLMQEKEQFEDDLLESQRKLIDSHASDLKARLTETDERTTATKNDLNALDKEVLELKTRLEDLEREKKEKLEAEDRFFKVELPALKTQLQEHVARREETDRSIRTLQEALEAYKNRPPPTPPATPSVTLTAPEYVMRALDDVLVERTRQHIRPMMEDTRNRIEDMVSAQSTELYTTVWGKLEMTRALVDRLHAIVAPGVGVKADPGPSPVDGSVAHSMLRNA